MGRWNATGARPFRSSTTQRWSSVTEKASEWWRRLRDGRLVLVVTCDDGEDLQSLQLPFFLRHWRIGCPHEERFQLNSPILIQNILNMLDNSSIRVTCMNWLVDQLDSMQRV
ncbi:hypothetical protein Fmac_021037 [Flemingia macrophylla]|uniref:Uncharacterized protein n=1 Tax=Flemingia macrophylla TaxID=520843 RepID=A0ABD1LVS2_9FABA